LFGTTIFFLLFSADWAKDIPRIVHAAAQQDYGPLAAVLPLNVLTAMPLHWGMRRSVLCSEDVTLTSEKEVRHASEQSIVGDTSNLGLLASCRRWPIGALPKDYFEPIHSDVPVLAISGVEDPVVPPHRAAAALATLSRATHLLVPGTSHAPNFPGCARDLAAQFLKQGSGNGLDRSCVLDVQRPRFTVPSDQ
jgi:pimeloyl-ACP methyl ester carboxylesterase